MEQIKEDYFNHPVIKDVKEDILLEIALLFDEISREEYNKKKRKLRYIGE